jgi:hypothetical protein
MDDQSQIIINHLLSISERLGHVEGVITTTLPLIHEETKKTNGRVTLLESDFTLYKTKMATIRGYKAGYLAAIIGVSSAVTSFLILVLKPLAPNFFKFIP